MLTEGHPGRQLSSALSQSTRRAGTAETRLEECYSQVCKHSDVGRLLHHVGAGEPVRVPHVRVFAPDIWKPELMMTVHKQDEESETGILGPTVGSGRATCG